MNLKTRKKAMEGEARRMKLLMKRAIHPKRAPYFLPNTS
jgi:hypothetical protein